MRKPIYFVLAVLIGLLLSETIFAQIEVPDEVSPYEPIIASVASSNVPEGAEIKTTWMIDEGAYIVPSTDTQVHLWGKPGTYRLSATVVWMKFNIVTVDGQELKVLESWDLVQYNKPLKIKGKVDPDNPNPPDPPDPVDPDVPEDEFGNIGQDVAKWGKELGINKAKEAAANYETAAARLLGEQTPILLTIDNAVEFISEENDKLDLNDAWLTLGQRINARWQKEVSDRSTAGKFFRAVSNGLKGV